MFIRSFSGRAYWFVPVTNEILAVRGASGGATEPLCDVPWRDVRSYMKICGQLRRPRWSVATLDEREIKARIEQHARNLILDITHRCNCRCDYCIFSGNFPGERSHSDRSMSASTAELAVRLFFDMSSKSESRTINFYGGEPLVEEGLLRHVVNFATSIDPSVSFHISTNLTLASPAFIRFCSENRVTMTATLDGPRDIHDRQRRLTSGEGTFDRVITALEMIKKEFPTYFRSALSVIYNVGPRADVSALLEFFRTHPTTRAIKHFRLNPIMASTSVDVSKRNSALVIGRELQMTYAHSLAEGSSDDHPARHVFGRGVEMLYQRPLAPSRSIPVNHCCIPGHHRMFVGIDGLVSPCEKCGPFLPIGTVEQGVDVHRVIEYLNLFRKDVEHRCTRCEIAHFCNMCLVYCKKGAIMDFDKKAGFCRSRRKYVQDCLRIMVSALEENPNCLER